MSDRIASVIGRSLVAALLSLGSLLVAEPACAEMPALSSAQLSALKKIPVPVYMPGALPAGFQLGKFQVHDPAKDPMSALGWGYSLQAHAPSGATLSIDEATSGFGGADPDYKGFRRPFVVATVLGKVHFTPSSDAKHGWCYGAMMNVPGAIDPPMGSKPAIMFTACGMERADVERAVRSMQLVKAQTPYPKG